MVNYQKLYATLLGRVDDALQYMVCDINAPRRMIGTAERLRAAIREAEEGALSAAEGEAGTSAAVSKKRRGERKGGLAALLCLWYTVFILKWGNMRDFLCPV